MRVMIRMFATTYGLSVTSTPTLLKGEPERAHHVRDHVQRPALHRAVEERPHALARLVGRHPVVRGPGGLARAAGDEREVLGAGDVGGVAAVQVGARGRRAGRARCSVPSASMPSTRRSFSASEPSHQTTRAGLSVAAISSTQRSTGFIGPTPATPERTTGHGQASSSGFYGLAKTVSRLRYSSSGVNGSATTSASRRASCVGRRAGVGLVAARAWRTSTSSAGRDVRVACPQRRRLLLGLHRHERERVGRRRDERQPPRRASRRASRRRCRRRTSGRTAPRRKRSGAM